MANREEIRKRIEARRAEKQAASRAKFARMRKAAEADPGEIEKDLVQLADACSAQAEAYENLRENLDLVQAPKEASLAARAKAARNYARAFMRIANEAPEQLADAVSEAYHSLDEQAGALETLAGHLGIDLNSTPAEEAFAAEGVQEIERADEAGFPLAEEVEEDAGEKEKEAAGSASDAWTTDRGDGGRPRDPERLEVPRTAAGASTDAFTTDRDEKGEPRPPQKAEVPRAKGESESPGNKGAAARARERRAAAAREAGGSHRAPGEPGALSSAQPSPRPRLYTRGDERFRIGARLHRQAIRDIGRRPLNLLPRGTAPQRGHRGGQKPSR